ncbi:polysaccharide ABC transporter ATP-binding protein [Winogradskyella sp. ECml5-4]|uniref:ABC transporter ATP-binding protein n=1 Tax=Winogradskyella sp. ECml5-4 TaxID=3110975 RepID=UPI002FF40728
MSDIILKAENISKQYRLGVVGTGTISHDLNRWWHIIRGKEDPFLKVGSVNDRSATKKSDYVWALEAINFEVERGEVLGVIGKNGAGKSTLLKILSRVTSPTTGEIKTKGRIASLLEVGTGFHPELTGRENIYLNGAILGMTKSEIKKKELDIIEFSGCQMYIDTPVKRYSSGMRVRLAFAVAAFLEPDILVIDEVLAVGDAEFQKKAIGKMQDISRGEGRTVIFVSHDMGAIQSLCSRLIVLKDGTVDFTGNVEDGVARYLSNISIGQINYFNDSIKVGIKKITFCNSEGNEIQTVLVGQKVLIKVELLNPDERNLTLSLGFTDMFNNFLFSCRSDVVNVNYSSSKAEALLTIHKWPVSQGAYYYNILTIDGMSALQFEKEAGIINVEKGDFYGTGKLPGKKRSFYIDYRWD